jgi:hypothetical protein
MLAEATATMLHRDRDSRSMEPLRRDAKDGGAVAGRTRKDIERQTGKPVISKKELQAIRREAHEEAESVSGQPRRAFTRRRIRHRASR